MSVWLNPQRVTFAGLVLEGVVRVRLEREPETMLVEVAGGGPGWVREETGNVVVEAVVEREMVEGVSFDPAPGTEGVLRFETATGRSDGKRRAVTLTGRAGRQRLRLERDGRSVWEQRFRAVWESGGADPLSVSVV